MDAVETPETGIALAIRLAGGVGALAKQLEESPQAVSNWRARRAAHANRCAAIRARIAAAMNQFATMRIRSTTCAIGSAAEGEVDRDMLTTLC